MSERRSASSPAAAVLLAGCLAWSACGAGTPGLLTPPPAPGNPPPAASIATPINDLGAATNKGFSGGLYPGGNAMPAAHADLGLQRALMVEPLDAAGQPSLSGKYVLLSIGMSNTTQEFCTGGTTGAPCRQESFTAQALADPAVDKERLAIADGARGGQSAEAWVSSQSPEYDRIRDNVLSPHGLSEAQVQVVWLKVANPAPNTALPAASADAYTLVQQMGSIARALKTRYPNLQQVFVSSRIYGGYASTALNPEPYAYESGFAVKWLIEAQLQQVQSGTVDARAGDLDPHSVAAWLAWGPYLWADGLNLRSDGLTWLRTDLQADGTHPSAAGVQKVGGLLLNFLKQSPHARCWFLSNATCP